MTPKKRKRVAPPSASTMEALKAIMEEVRMKCPEYMENNMNLDWHISVTITVREARNLGSWLRNQ